MCGLLPVVPTFNLPDTEKFLLKATPLTLIKVLVFATPLVSAISKDSVFK